jgi:hypothetical protein
VGSKHLLLLARLLGLRLLASHRFPLFALAVVVVVVKVAVTLTAAAVAAALQPTSITTQLHPALHTP